MSNKVYKLEWGKEELWKGCILASLAHAIMVAHYPDLSNEHSWDGLNYSVQDSSGVRGTVTFSSDYVVAAFRNDHSEILDQPNGNHAAIKYFEGAPIEVIEIAESETLEYLLEDAQGSAIPLITSSFWGKGGNCYSINSKESLFEQGAHLLEFQLMNFEEALESWKEYYEMSPEQSSLLVSLYNRKITHPLDVIVLSEKEIQLIGTDDEEGLEESQVSFEELGVEWM
ncbi:hypothetical protein [Paenibacillus sp. 481]|uniref:hypothetical protein n=1 Tax=Paenibacillus sp. 481 TaxID=2835869 RepID=UPI001E2D476C|nr:hypothetical protein [Paenibacillus sp. 481]UHA74904.1 hypothetical protein KIK04_07650 [Paenibacillus sp. 481]